MISKFTFFFFFFFQAEDGIRDWSVTGVQTCALPSIPELIGETEDRVGSRVKRRAVQQMLAREPVRAEVIQIGRASCRERVEISVGGGSLKKKKKEEGSRKRR